MIDWIGITGLVVGLAGLGYAVYEQRKRARVEDVTRNTLRRIAGLMRVIFSNADWTNGHLRNIGHTFAEDSPNMAYIRKEALDGARDAASCARQLALAQSWIKAIQESLFDDSEETLPDIPSDDVRAAQRSIDEAKGIVKSQVASAP